MATAKSKPISINDQLVAVTQRAAKIRSSLDTHRAPERRETASTRQSRKAPPEMERRPGTDGVSGTRIDLVA